MLTFKPVTLRDGGRLRKYYENCDYGLCEYSVGTKLMWRDKLRPAWAEAAGCLIVRVRSGGRWSFDYPVAGPEGDEEAALAAIEEWCRENGVSPAYNVVPESRTCRLLARYPYVTVSDIRSWRDYIYYRQDLQLFAGRRYSGQRNHIKKFRTLCPEAEIRCLTDEDEAAIEQFWRDYEAEFPKGGNAKARNELELAKKMLKLRDRKWFTAGGLFDGEKLIALSLAEQCGETLIIHIEKALYSYTGVYPTFVQAFADAFGGGCQWINREDDAADRGLRTSKLQYGPAKLASKFCFEVQNELMRHVEVIPELKTERLILSALTEADIPAYNALVLDADRNRWWGYDDVGGLGKPVEERSFYEVAETDFANRQAVNFAIRLDGKLIGEAVLYHFDCQGGAELGCRIDKAYAGHGYGTEAFGAVANWGLYKVNLSRVVAKCFKENQASYKMLSACMRRSGEDETFYYFEKQV